MIYQTWAVRALAEATERAATAMAGDEWTDASAARRNYWREKARAALEAALPVIGAAIREPQA